MNKHLSELSAACFKFVIYIRDKLKCSVYMLSYFERHPPEQFLHYCSFPNNGVRNHASQRPGLYLPQTPWVMWSIFISLGSPEVVKASATGTAPISPSGVVSQKTFMFVNEPFCSIRSIAVQILFPFLVAGFGMVGAGIVLDIVQHWNVFKEINELFILVPALLGLKGNLEMTLASRLSTLVRTLLLVQGSLGLPGLSGFQEHKSLERLLGPQCS
jgi:hypothetical protein